MAFLQENILDAKLALFAVSSAHADMSDAPVAQDGVEGLPFRLEPHIEVPAVAARAPPFLPREGGELVAQMRAVVEVFDLKRAIFIVEQRDRRVVAVGRPFVSAQQILHPAQDAAVREYGDRFSVVFLRSLPQRRQKALRIFREGLAVLHRPELRFLVELRHTLRLEALEPSERDILPAAEIDLAEATVAAQLQSLWQVNGACRHAGAVQVAGVAGVDGNVLKAYPERIDLPQAVGRDAGIILSVDAAVGVSLRFRVPYQIDSCHIRSA